MRQNAAKVSSDYLKPLYKNKYTTDKTLSFADVIKRLPLLPDDEKYV